MTCKIESLTDPNNTKINTNITSLKNQKNNNTIKCIYTLPIGRYKIGAQENYTVDPTDVKTVYSENEFLEVYDKNSNIQGKL